MKKLYDAIGKFEWGLTAIGAGLCLFAIMIVTVLSVFGRYVLHTDLIPGSFNIIERMLFPLMVFWALPLAHRDGIFPRLDSIADALPGKSGATVAIFVLVVELAIFFFILWHMIVYSLDGWETDRTMQLGSSFFPVWPFIMMVPLALALMCFEIVWQISCQIRYFAVGGERPQSQHDPVKAME